MPDIKESASPAEPVASAPTRRPRHSDVARRAGVSPATVSKVITGRESDRISAETRHRVMEVVTEMNYVPRSAVREMQTGRTGRIGVLLCHPAAFGAIDPYHTAILGGILSEAFTYRRNTLLYTALEPRAESLRREILGGGADAVIAVGRVWNPLVESIASRANLPVIYVSVLPPKTDTVRNVPYFAVDCDNAGGGRLGVAHLAELGHRRIALVCGAISGEPQSFIVERLAGAMAAASEYGIVLSQVTPDELPALIQRIGSTADAPTALFLIEGEGGCAEIIQTLAPQAGLCVPETLSLVAFNSTSISELAPVPVTAVRQPFSDIGAKAVEIAVDYLENAATAVNKAGSIVRLPVRLDVRASTAPPAKR